MKKVAVVMESWMRYFTYAWPAGMLQRIRETDEDVSLYIFNSSANWSSDVRYNAGEYNIFHLPDFKDFDGVIIDLNNTLDDSVRQEVIERVRESKVPGIVINNHYEGLYSVGIDNYAAMRQMIDHLYEHHGCRTYWFILGPKDNYESAERERALKTYISEKKLPEADCKFYYDDFDFNTGVFGFQNLYGETHSVPDAIVCANDNIAVGVLSEAEKHGLSAPHDFLITGFDDLDKSRYYTPRISTMSYIREDAGYAGMEMLIEIWNGQTPETYYHTKASPIFWESCGCESEIVVDPRQQMKGSILWNVEQSYFEGCKLDLDSKLAHVDTMEEMLACIPESIPAFRCDAMYLAADKHLLDLDTEKTDVDKVSPAANMEDEFLIQGYPKDLRLVLAYGDERANRIAGESRIVNGLFPLFETEEKGQNFLFLPLHFRDRCIGYFAIKNAIYLMEQQFLFDIMNSLTSGIEQLYYRSKLARLNHALSVLYNHDSMTGLYNRLGFTEHAERFYRKILAKGSSVAVVYVDLDRLKYINDNYGHEMGDYAIKTIAGMVQSITSDQGFDFRLGGDEFLILDELISEQDLIGRLDSLSKRLADISKRERLPYTMSASVGYVIGSPEKNSPLDLLVQQADDIMYASKVARKMQRES